MDFVARLGAIALEQFRGWGHAAFFFLDLLVAVPASLRRFGLVIAQVHAIGNRSLVIIMASGLAVGFVLALQMYYALVAYGAAESLGLIVNPVSYTHLDVYKRQRLHRSEIGRAHV